MLHRNAARVRCCIANPSVIEHSRLDAGFRVRGQAIVETRTLSPLAALFDDSIGGRHHRPADPCSHVNMMAVKMECMSRQQEIRTQQAILDDDAGNCLIRVPLFDGAADSWRKIPSHSDGPYWPMDQHK